MDDFRGIAENVTATAAIDAWSDDGGPATLFPTSSEAPPSTEIEPEENTYENLVVDLTHRCNMQCANCYIPNRDIPDMDSAKLFAFLRRLPSRVYLRLIGAEPTMRSDLPEIIRRVIDLGHKPILVTNGLKLAREDYVRALAEAGLRTVLISMNGADDDSVYRVLDGGKYASLKRRALTNAFAHSLTINTGTIIARGVNEHVIARQIQIVTEAARDAGVDLSVDVPYRRLPPVIRLKSVGRIGRHMTGVGYSYDELLSVVCRELGIEKTFALSHPSQRGRISPVPAARLEGLLQFPVSAGRGVIYVKLLDWDTQVSGVIDKGNPNRGRITQNWRIAPFFDHVKANEFGY